MTQPQQRAAQKSAADMPKTYEPQAVEKDLYATWEESGYFNPDVCIDKGVTAADAQPFSMVLPPPNVTGVLHTGHAAMLAVEDLMTRYHRMRGDRTLWIPGTDHAAIATQSKVEKLLKAETGQTRYDLGRDAFLREVNQFAQDSHDTIVGQCRAMGASLDWSREAFTLDGARHAAVTEAFTRMYNDGLIYRGDRIVNWDPVGQTTVSDDEVQHEDRQAKLYTFRYAKDFPIAISTTRPETKVGDTAVAVHPDDERYAQYVGQTFEVANFCGAKLSIKVIADPEVEKDFGTGALGVTPCHSQIDWDMSERHNLARIQVIDENAQMTLEAGATVAGQTTEEARNTVVTWLRDNNLLEAEEDVTQSVSTAERTGGIIEPLPKEQWFIAVNKEFERDGKMVTLKSLMLDAVKSGATDIIPERFEKVYFHWITNLRDWCISRQIWYGHQVPVWYCLGCKKPRVNAKVKSKWYFVRHGETEDNIQRRNSGSVDVPLNETGRAQALEAGTRLLGCGITKIICSPQNRAEQTARIIAEQIGVTDIEIDDRLRERHFGRAEGMLYDEAKEKFPDLKSYYGKSADNENSEETEQRVWSAIMDHLGDHAHQNVLITSHGGALRALVRKIRNINPEEVMAIPGFPLPNATPFDVDICDPCENCGGHFWEQDPDTLDTWFSSGLWTFSTLGWPDTDAPDFKTYHPTNVLETGYDILPFWVARMILMSTYLVGDVPFKVTYLHGLVRDEKGQKMSKSLGNAIDPVDVSAQYGTDAVRLALLIGATPGNDMRLGEDKIASYRNFTNKLWNIGRYVLTMSEAAGERTARTKADLSRTKADAWILARLNATIAEVTAHLDSYRFSQAGETLRDFTWNDFADWYVEIHKIEKNDALLRYVFRQILALWHPFMPFVTEELFGYIKTDDPSNTETGRDFLMVSAWPQTTISDATAAEFDAIKDLVTAVRNIRAVYRLTPDQKPVLACDAALAATVSDAHPLITRLARVSDITAHDGDAPHGSATVTTSAGTGYILLEGVIDIAAEKARLTAELADAEKNARDKEARLANDSFTARAPEAIVAKERELLAQAQSRATEIRASLESLS